MSSKINPPIEPVARTAVRIAGECCEVKATALDLAYIRACLNGRDTLTLTISTLITRLVYELKRTNIGPGHPGFADAINGLAVTLGGRGSTVALANEAVRGNDGPGNRGDARPAEGGDDKPPVLPSGDSGKKVGAKRKNGKSTVG